jgi:hypothetical protein
MDREELLEREELSWAAFEAAVSRIPAERREEEGVVPGWSVKDLVWHCGYWAEYAVGLLRRIADGTYVEEDHPDEYWDAINAQVAEESKAMTVEEADARARAARDRAREALLSLPELTESAADEFSSETFEHYDEHAAEITRFADAI